MPSLPLATATADGDSFAFHVPRSATPGLKPGEPLGVVSHGAEGLLLLKRAEADGYLAGDFSAMSVGEVVGHLVAGVRSGKLLLARGGVRKTIAFREGQIAFASSTDPRERLGRFLVSRRLISQEQLESALAQVVPGTRLGQVLTRERTLSPAVLYGAMAELVAEIVLALFEWEDGHFLWIEGEPAADAIKLSKRTRDLLLEGVRRADHVARFRRFLPWNKRVAVGAVAPPPELGALVSAASGKGPDVELGALRLSFEGSDFSFYTAVNALLTSGALVPSGATAPEPAMNYAAVGSAEQMYQSLIRTICQALRNAGKDLTDLHSFFIDPLPGMEEPFQGVRLGEDGRLDVDQVMANQRDLDPAFARASAYEALDAFVSYALFAAKNVLPPDLAEVLHEDFKRLQEGRER